jgi:hypothetical protein
MHEPIDKLEQRFAILMVYAVVYDFAKKAAPTSRVP